MSTRRGDAAQIIWLSDLHYDDAPVVGHDPVARVEAAIEYVNTHYGDADLCMISGDLVETATAQSYAAVIRRLNRLAMPWMAVPGNHDRRALFLDHVPQHGSVMPGFAQCVVDLPGLRVIGLDTLVEGKDHGWLCEVRLDWLSTQLQAGDDTPVIVFLHHPPVDLGLPMLDPDRLHNGEALLTLLARFPSVRQLCFGHVHRPVAGSIRGLAYTGLRSALYQAPPPVPAWDWTTFKPVLEAPELGVVTCHADHISAFRPCRFATPLLALRQHRVEPLERNRPCAPSAIPHSARPVTCWSWAICPPRHPEQAKCWCDWPARA